MCKQVSCCAKKLKLTQNLCKHRGIFAEDRLNSFLFGKAGALIGRRSSSFIKEQYLGIVCRHLLENIRTALLPMIFFSFYVYFCSSIVCKIL